MTPELKTALRELRRVRAMRPQDSASAVTFAGWREAIATALDELAVHLLFPEDRLRAAAEAAAARDETAQLRSPPT
ncbi:hypothetical protein GCM10010411_73990 [Actinomadura fulvescens]|uniref:Uncharacterized protein n=1 Tax=Actinomadura fulvescens TaxID=46160 RepID=A0ABP6CQX1_9ACTN